MNWPPPCFKDNVLICALFWRLPLTSLYLNYVKPCFNLFQFSYNFMTKGFFFKTWTSVRTYSRWNRISDFSHFLVFWPLFGLKHLVWGSQFITSKVTMPKLTLRRKFHWKMPYFWAFYHSKLRRKNIHFFIEWVSYIL